MIRKLVTDASALSSPMTPSRQGTLTYGWPNPLR